MENNPYSAAFFGIRIFNGKEMIYPVDFTMKLNLVNQTETISAVVEQQTYDESGFMRRTSGKAINGVIYEHDIVEFPDGTVGEAVYQAEKGLFVILSKKEEIIICPNMPLCQIIGNTFETPSLLKTSKTKKNTTQEGEYASSSKKTDDSRTTKPEESIEPLSDTMQGNSADSVSGIAETDIPDEDTDNCGNTDTLPADNTGTDNRTSGNQDFTEAEDNDNLWLEKDEKTASTNENSEKDKEKTADMENETKSQTKISLKKEPNETKDENVEDTPLSLIKESEISEQNETICSSEENNDKNAAAENQPKQLSFEKPPVSTESAVSESQPIQNALEEEYDDDDDYDEDDMVKIIVPEQLADTKAETDGTVLQSDDLDEKARQELLQKIQDYQTSHHQSNQQEALSFLTDEAEDIFESMLFDFQNNQTETDDSEAFKDAPFMTKESSSVKKEQPVVLPKAIKTPPLDKKENEKTPSQKVPNGADQKQSKKTASASQPPKKQDKNEKPASGKKFPLHINLHLETYCPESDCLVNGTYSYAVKNNNAQNTVFSTMIVPNVTQHRLELTALITALNTLDKDIPVDIYTTIQYLVYPFTKGWISNWASNGWRKAGAEDRIQHYDLWKQLYLSVKQRQIKWHCIKEGELKINDQCANFAIDKFASLTIN